MKKYLSRILLIVAFFSPAGRANYNQSLFYRVSSFWGEPRYTKPWLSTIDFQFSGGSSDSGRDCTGRRRNLLSVYGKEDVAAWNKVSPENPLILVDDVRMLCFNAKASIFETDINLYQNFSSGFYTHFYLPIIVLNIFPFGFIDSDYSAKHPNNENRPQRERPIEQVSPFLEQFNLFPNQIDSAGLSDAILFFGWSGSIEDTCYVDFVDTTLKTGVLFPTGREKDLNSIFDIAYGNNGHWAIPIWWDLTVGLFDWLTFGFHSEAYFFKDKLRCTRMKSPQEAQTGWIVLGKGAANIQQGALWKLGSYFKADHFFNGFSLLIAFSYEQKNSDLVTPCDNTLFDKRQVNNDPHFLTWARSIFHIQADYDFTCRDAHYGAQVGFFYNHEMTGLRTFNLTTGGSYLGVDVNWCF